MRRKLLLGLLAALPLVAVPLVWAAASGGTGAGVCAIDERAGRPGLLEGEPKVAPVAWGAHRRAVPAERLGHNLRHGGVAVEYGDRVPAAELRRLLAWYRTDPVAVVVAPRPELGARLVLSSWSGSARCRAFEADAFSRFRADRRFQGPESPPLAELRPARAVESLTAGARRIEFVLSAAGSAQVEIRDARGRVVRTLGNYTVAGRQQLVLAWNGRGTDGERLRAGRYTAVVTARTDARAGVFRAPFRLG